MGDVAGQVDHFAGHGVDAHFSPDFVGLEAVDGQVPGQAQLIALTDVDQFGRHRLTGQSVAGELLVTALGPPRAANPCGGPAIGDLKYSAAARCVALASAARPLSPESDAAAAHSRVKSGACPVPTEA